MRVGNCVALCVALLGIQSVVFAEDEDTVKKIESKPTERVSATTIDFRSSLALGFDSLDKLGGRIECARDAGDPVGLAAAASELMVAESVSGKKAALTSAELTKEAIDLAKLRDDSAELSAVAMILADKSGDLTKQAAAAKKREASEASSGKDFEETRGIEHELIVANESEAYVRIYANGRYLGAVRPFGQAHFHVHIDGDVELDGVGHGHRFHEHVHGDYHEYQWTLHDH